MLIDVCWPHPFCLERTGPILSSLKGDPARERHNPTEPIGAVGHWMIIIARTRADRLARNAGKGASSPVRCGPREARDAVEAHGLEGFGQGHHRQDGGKLPGQHRWPGPKWPQEEDVRGRTLALPSLLHLHCPSRGSMTTKLSLATHEP